MKPFRAGVVPSTRFIFNVISTTPVYVGDVKITFFISSVFQEPRFTAGVVVVTRNVVGVVCVTGIDVDVVKVPRFTAGAVVSVTHIVVSVISVTNIVVGVVKVPRFTVVTITVFYAAENWIGSRPLELGYQAAKSLQLGCQAAICHGKSIHFIVGWLFELYLFFF